MMLLEIFGRIYQGENALWIFEWYVEEESPLRMLCPVACLTK